jgi:hypothetical protein
MFDEHTFLLQLRDDARHGGAGQASSPGELGAAGGTRLAQGRNDPTAIASAARVGSAGHKTTIGPL